MPEDDLVFCRSLAYGDVGSRRDGLEKGGTGERSKTRRLKTCGTNSAGRFQKSRNISKGKGVNYMEGVLAGEDEG